MIVHFAKGSRKLCPNGGLRGGILYSKAFSSWAKMDATELSHYQFVYTTSDNHVTCLGCLKLRIEFHEFEAGKLRRKLNRAAGV